MTDDFRTRVLALVGRIPEGKVLSYGRLSALAGRPRHARLVGHIMARQTHGLDLPCHRVVKADGSLCEGYEFGVMGLQRALLRAEGVPFTRAGRVNMKKAQWDGPGAP